MDKENSSFFAGIGLGIVTVLLLFAIIGVWMWQGENSGYENKLVIKYHNPYTKYDREMVEKMLEVSGVSTNFINKEIELSPWRMEWRFTNPTGNKHNN